MKERAQQSTVPAEVMDLWDSMVSIQHQVKEILRRLDRIEGETAKRNTA